MPESKLTQKVGIVTGASSGIGEAIALELVAEGAEEVASLVALVASPLGGFINGASLRVDGGYVVGVN